MKISTRLSFIGAATLALSAVATPLSFSTVSGAAVTPSCSNLTKAAVVADGFSAASTPVITPYNYTKASANAANALGTTIDFGAKALVVSCVSPSDIAKLAASAKLPSTTTATSYMAYLVKQSAGAMTKTLVGGVNDYLDFGNGKEDGLGPTSTAGSVRLDAWVAHNFIVLTFIAPATAKPSTALLNFIKTTNQVL